MAPNRKKYENTILYLAQKLGGEIKGKKKLAKLLYFVDFDYYELHEESVTGDEYLALPMGPFPIKMDKTVKSLTKSEMMSIESREERVGYRPTEAYVASKEPDVSVFKDAEIEMLDRVVRKYGHLNGTQLENLSHAEAPYIGTSPNCEIMYELSMYRGTDFSGDN